jgi:dihydroorotase
VTEARGGQALLIVGGHVIDPASELDTVADVLIEDGRITAIGAGPDGRLRGGSADRLTVLDAQGLVVAPGFVDLHTHLREPGYEYKETIETGTQAAARGGFTTVCAMPNTDPPMDSRATIDYVRQRAAATGVVRVLPIGCVTRDRAGQQLAELGELAAAGCVGFSDDGAPVADAAIMRRALEYASGFGLPVIDHCEDPVLGGGVMHEGWVSTRLGLSGIPASSEETAVARDLALAKQTGAHIHIAHLSTAGSVGLVRRAKAEGVRVSAEITPHHLVLTHEAVMYSGAAASAEMGRGVPAFDTHAKMYPPLRSAEDVEACIEGLADATIDAIATDHAPHAVQEKLCEFDTAAFGMVGLETALPLALSTGLPVQRIVEALTVGPVRALGLDRHLEGIGTLAVGSRADVVLFDPAREWTVAPEALASKGKNTPLIGRNVRGQVVATVYRGDVVHALKGMVATR